MSDGCNAQDKRFSFAGININFREYQLWARGLV
jgi:hypothetical protein